LGSWPDDERRRALLARLQESSRLTDEEFQYRTRSGEVRTGIISMEVVHLAGEPYVLAGSFDITERQRMEDALRASGDRFLTIFRRSPIPMSIGARAEGRLVHVNDAYVRIAGYSRDELIGATTTDLGLVAPELRLEHLRHYDEVGPIRNREVKIVT